MYKIYINENLLVISDREEHLSLCVEGEKKVVPFFLGAKSLLNFIDKLEKTGDKTTLVLTNDDPKQVFKKFKSLYKRIEAAGGIVQNKEGNVLLIYRLGWWDLPKGKMEFGEKRREAALREVKEETGLDCLIEQKAGVTWHTYINPKGRRVLKRTHWYRMVDKATSDVSLQVEEHIVDSTWMTLQELQRSKGKCYRSIASLLDEIFSE